MTRLSCRYGPMNVPERPDLIFNSLRQYGEWAQAELDILAHFIRSGDIVVDAGAFVGTHSRAFSAMVGDQGEVHAFEPNAESSALLASNAVLAPQANISIYQVALGREPCSAGLFVPGAAAGNAGATHVEQEPAGGSSSRVIVSCLDAFPWPRLDFIKADVEGMELDLLLGGEETIRRNSPRLFLEINTLHRAGALIAWAQARNYLVFGVLSPAFNPANFRGATANIFGMAGECGLLLISRCRHSEWRDTLEALNLPLLMTLDDLALLLLHKPQYIYETLSATSVFAVLGGDIAIPSLAERDGQIAALQQVSLQLAGDLATMGRTLAERDGQLAELHQSLAARAGEVAQLQLRQTEQQTKLEELCQQLADREQQQEELSAISAAQAEHLTKLQNVVLPRQKRLIADLEAAKIDLQHEVRDLRTRLADQDGQILSQIQRLAVLQVEYHSLLNSRSWRLTEPLRRLRRFCRK